MSEPTAGVYVGSGTVLFCRYCHQLWEDREGYEEEHRRKCYGADVFIRTSSYDLGLAAAECDYAIARADKERAFIEKTIRERAERKAMKGA